MNYLLDTHILLHALMSPENLSAKVIEILQNADTNCTVSAISFWEISLKFAKGKLALNGITPADMPLKCKEMGFRIIDISSRDTASYNQLESLVHKDPFDRMLIWQAIQNNYVLISYDRLIKKYAVKGLKVVN